MEHAPPQQRKQFGSVSAAILKPRALHELTHDESSQTTMHEDSDSSQSMLTFPCKNKTSSGVLHQQYVASLNQYFNSLQSDRCSPSCCPLTSKSKLWLHPARRQTMTSRRPSQLRSRSGSTSGAFQRRTASRPSMRKWRLLQRKLCSQTPVRKCRVLRK